MKVVKKMIILNVLICSIGFCACERKEESLLPVAQETTIQNKTESNVVSEDIEIDKEYLEKKYPGKTVLTWVYAEIENISEEEREEYNQPLGMKYITNNQIEKLNDYLVSKGKEYVIYFKKLNGGQDYAKEIEQMEQEGEAPDFIFAEWYLDETKKNYVSYLTYDLIGKDMLEELSQYKYSDLKDYVATLPSNGIKLSSINGNFYGYNEGISQQVISYDWYVNVDLADQYDIDINNFGGGGYKEWMDASNKVYAGEKKKGSTNFLLCEGSILKPIAESNIAGYIGKINRKGNVNTNAFGVSLEGKRIDNYYKLSDVKKSLKEISEYVKKGYFKYLNENKRDNTINANVFISNLYFEEVEGRETEVEWSVFPKVKYVKQYKWGNCSVKAQELIDGNAINGIYKKSNNKKIALSAYNFINSDVEASNIIKFPEYDGSGGQYNITLSEYYDFFSREENQGKFEGRGYKFVNPFVANPFADKNSIEVSKKNVESLKYNEKYIDKYYDFTQVKKEIENIIKVEKKYLGQDYNYNGGSYDGKLFKEDFDSAYNDFLKELDEAGIEKVLSYLNNE